MLSFYQERIRRSRDILDACLDEGVLHTVHQVSLMAKETLLHGGKILFCGNGGSFSDAEHLVGELAGRFYRDREALAAISLGSNGALLTAVGNDYDYDTIFSRELRALGRSGDLLIAISTSGNSSNIIKAVEAASEIGVRSVAITGKKGIKLGSMTDIWLAIPAEDTPRIQEAYKVIGHCICEYLEQECCP